VGLSWGGVGGLPSMGGTAWTQDSHSAGAIAHTHVVAFAPDRSLGAASLTVGRWAPRTGTVECPLSTFGRWAVWGTIGRSVYGTRAQYACSLIRLEGTSVGVDWAGPVGLVSWMGFGRPRARYALGLCFDWAPRLRGGLWDRACGQRLRISAT
jgi:hypothetical protein